MSFAQSLRMRNMFPVHTDLGSAEIDLSGLDPITRYHEELQRNKPMNGLQQVARMATERQPIQEPLRFGGVVGPVSNPGADILRRSAESANRIYEGYKKPQIQASDLIEPNEQFPTESTDFMLKDKQLNSNISNANRRAGLDERRIADSENRTKLMGDKGWKMGVITDPKDPSKQINVRYNEQTGDVQKLELPDGSTGAINRPGINKPSVQPKNLDSIRTSAQQSLDAISQFLDDKDELTDAGKNVSGGSAVLNRIPFTEQRGQSNTLNRIKASQIISLIGEMKSQSKTGATGFGALNMKELGVLEDAASQLDTYTDEASFKRELKRIKDRLKLIMQDESPSSNSNGKTDSNSLLDTNRPENRIKVKAPNGKTGTWPANKTLPQGYERIQ